MAKNTSKNFKIYCPVFDYTFFVFIGSRDSFNKWVKRRFSEMYNLIMQYDTAAGLCTAGSSGAVIFIADKKDLESIVHECHHAISGMFSNRSEIRNDSPSMEEVESYYNGWLVKEITDKLKEKKRRRKNVDK